jgi:hypothetical protein
VDRLGGEHAIIDFLSIGSSANFRRPGITVDPAGNVWVLGAGNGLVGDGNPDISSSDGGVALKFTADGKFSMQIGGRGEARDDSDTARLGRASKIAFDASGNEAYIADGYSNHRVIVFDSNTGEFRRMWGAYGGPPADHELINGDTQLSGRFNLLHCVARAADGLVYVRDRDNQRIQVFRRRSTHRPLSADGDSADRQDSADRPAHSPP